jgi:hypothetical protein
MLVWCAHRWSVRGWPARRALGTTCAPLVPRTTGLVHRPPPVTPTSACICYSVAVETHALHAPLLREEARAATSIYRPFPHPTRDAEIMLLVGARWCDALRLLASHVATFLTILPSPPRVRSSGHPVLQLRARDAAGTRVESAQRAPAPRQIIALAPPGSLSSRAARYFDARPIHCSTWKTRELTQKYAVGLCITSAPTEIASSVYSQDCRCSN